MKLKKILEELKNYIIQVTFDDFMHVFIAFPKDWDMTSFFDDNEVYILENSKKTFEENNKIYTIYEFILKSNDFVDDLFNIIIQIKNTFLEKEKMLFELNKKVEQEKLDLERIVNEKINNLRGTQLNKKPKNDLIQKLEETTESKSIDDIMTSYSK